MATSAERATAREKQTHDMYRQASWDAAHSQGDPYSTTQDYDTGVRRFGAPTKRQKFQNIRQHQQRLKRIGWDRMSREEQTRVANQTGFNSAEAFYRGGLPAMGRAQAGVNRPGGRYFEIVDPQSIKAAEQAIAMADTPEKRRASIEAARRLPGAENSAAIKMWGDMADRNALPSTELEKNQAATMQNQANRIAYDSKTKNLNDKQRNDEARIAASVIPVQEYYPSEAVNVNIGWKGSYERFNDLMNALGDDAPNHQIYQALQKEIGIAEMYARRYAIDMTNRVTKFDAAMSGLPEAHQKQLLADMFASNPAVARKWQEEWAGTTRVGSYAQKQAEQKQKVKDFREVSVAAAKGASIYHDSTAFASTAEEATRREANERIKTASRDRAAFVRMQQVIHPGMSARDIMELWGNAYRIQTGQEPPPGQEPSPLRGPQGQLQGQGTQGQGQPATPPEAAGRQKNKSSVFDALFRSHPGKFDPSLIKDKDADSPGGPEWIDTLAEGGYEGTPEWGRPATPPEAAVRGQGQLLREQAAPWAALSPEEEEEARDREYKREKAYRLSLHPRDRKRYDRAQIRQGRRPAGRVDWDRYKPDEKPPIPGSYAYGQQKKKKAEDQEVLAQVKEALMLPEEATLADAKDKLLLPQTATLEEVAEATGLKALGDKKRKSLNEKLSFSEWKKKNKGKGLVELSKKGYHIVGGKKVPFGPSDGGSRSDYKIKQSASVLGVNA